MSRVKACLLLLTLAGMLHSLPLRAEIRPSATNTNRYDFYFEDEPLTGVIRQVCLTCGPNMLYNPTELQGRVTAHLKDVEWLPAFNACLAQHDFEVVTCASYSGVYSVRRCFNTSGYVLLLFRPPGGMQSTNRFSVKVVEGTLGKLLAEIAEKARVNVAYAPSIAQEGNITIQYDNVSCDEVLNQVSDLWSVDITYSFRLGCYVVAGPETVVVSAAPVAGKPVSLIRFPSTQGALTLLAAAVLIAFMFRLAVRREVNPSEAARGLRARWGVRATWIAILFLSAFYSLISVAWLFWKYQETSLEYSGIGRVLVVSAAVTAIVFTVSVLVIRACGKRGLRLRGWLQVALWLVAFLPFAIIEMDSPPPRADYDRSDLPKPAAGAEESAMYYEKLCDTNFIRCDEGLTRLLGRAEIVTNTVRYSVEIEEAWQDISEARKLVARLNEFDGITDPIALAPIAPTAGLTSTMGFTRLSRIYEAYALLRACQGNTSEAAAQLAELYNVIRKALPYAPTVEAKIRLSVLGCACIDAAHDIVCRPDCTAEAREVLRTAFVPLTHGDVSLKVPFIFEYLCKRDFFGHKMARSEFIGSFPIFYTHEIIGVSAESEPQQQYGFKERLLSRVVAVLFFKRNRTIRDLREYYNVMIAGAEKCPPDLSATETWNERYVRQPRVRNLGGWFLLLYATPSYFRAQARVSDTKVRSDLLALELNLSAGKQMNLRDYYTGSDYIVNVRNGRYASAGADGKPGTEDDVILGKRRR